MIKIVRNNAGNCVNFVGSSNPTYWNACLSAEVNADNANNLNIKNDIRSVAGGETVYEFFNMPYTSFADKDGNAFADVQEAIDYIDAQANVAGNTGRFILSATDTLDFTVDGTNTTILLDNGDNYAINSISASENDDGHIDISTHTGDIIIYKDLRVGNATIDSAAVNATVATAVNELNSLFTQSASVGSAPVITSTLTPSIVQGNTFNYEATADDGVAYEWSNLPSGVAPVPGNPRKLIGGSSLAVGTYNIGLKAINYYGEDTETVVLTVDTPPWADTYSVRFPTSNDYAQYDNTGNGNFSGFVKPHNGVTSDWTIACWFKPNNSSDTNQTIWSIASHQNTWDNYIELRWTGRATYNRYFMLYLNDNSQAGGQGRTVLETPTSGSSWPVLHNTWHHIVFTNGGGGDYTNSGHNLTFYLNGVKVTNTQGKNLILAAQTNGGLSTGSIDARYLNVSKSAGGGNYLRSSLVNELALWNDELTQAEVTALYNSGTPHDLTLLSNAPDNYYRMGDEDTFPTLQDSVGNADLTMKNMIVGDIVSDTP